MNYVVHDAHALQCVGVPTRIMQTGSRKTLMRSLGEFVGYIVKGVKTDPGRKIVSKKIEQEQRGDVVLRRTTIEELEIREKRP